MPDLTLVILIALMPAAGNLIGNLLAEFFLPPDWLVGALLHGAAGIAIALISFDLMPQVTDTLKPLQIALGFAFGAALSVALAYGIRSLRDEHGGRGHHAWMIYIAIGADLFSDGLMTGAGTAISTGLGMLIAGAQLVANIPGGFASAANLRLHNVPARARLLASTLLFGSVIASALIGYMALQGRADTLQDLALAAIAGLLLLATVEDMIPEADKPRPSRWFSSLAFTIGFCGLALVSRGVG